MDSDEKSPSESLRNEEEGAADQNSFPEAEKIAGEKQSKENHSEEKKSKALFDEKRQISLLSGFIGKPLIVHTEWKDVKFSFPAPKIRFGKGISKEVPQAIFELLDPMLPYIKKAEISQPKTMIVIGNTAVKENGALDHIIDTCKNNAIETFVYSIGKGEPTVDMVNKGVKLALENKPHYIVGLGGGSVLDVAKAIAGIATNGGLVEDYHDGKPFEVPGLPFIAIPTTAGTGSEITNNSVLIDPLRGFKRSIRGNQIVSKYILLDPELTLSCPPEVSAASGADALVQAIEAYVSKRSHPIADIYAMQAIMLIAPNLRRVVENGQDYAARAEMMLGSFFAGVAFSNVGLGLVHGLAHPIGYKYQISHGKICAALLPYVIEYNAEENPVKYVKIAQVINQLDLFTKYEASCSDFENARRLAGMIKELFAQVQIPIRLRDLGILKDDFNWIVENTKGGSVNSNPRKPTAEEIGHLLENAW
ncbi:iron-containing alcohol dehydrogenase family protein [Candidatus Harpocratesius sp.]